jgi:hypothetical protein
MGEFQHDDTAESYMRAVTTAARAVSEATERELERLIDAGHLVSHVAYEQSYPAVTSIMSGSLILSRIGWRKEDLRLTLFVERYDQEVVSVGSETGGDKPVT